MKYSYEIRFLDGAVAVVAESTLSRAAVLAAHDRMIVGAETHRELHVIGGMRRPDLDVNAEAQV